MWKRLSLRARILALLMALVLTTIGGGLVTLWHNAAMDSLLTSLIDKNVASYHAAEELESALLQQKGFLTYYFLDGNPEWLKEIERYSRAFEGWLVKARESAYTEAMKEIIAQIDVQHHQYVIARERVIALYREGQRKAGAELHWEIRQQYVAILNLCQRYKLTHEYAISRARTESQARARFINAFALVAVPAAAVLGVLLAYILIKQILGPIRRLALETTPANPDHRVPDEVKALSTRVHSLIEDVDQAQTELERSQEHLLQSGKLAMVGKLAAGVAHSIRNPLTSVNFRLHCLKSTLAMSPSQQDDFQVISEEIRHIDSILRNFLEFSRPPKLKVQRVSPSDVVNMALVLLRYRLESYGVEVKLIRPHRLPEIWADPDQLKEVLANLLVNACEVMVNGGVITIQEEERLEPPLGPAVVIRMSDNGPGIPESVRDQVFQPFFSTKEEGTGLGLSIATRIIEDHGGRLELESRENEGATFIITLPLGKNESWATS
ncbi:MAG: histidine kinase [Deltaproteobacteria bacterium]|nr:histidine kinase [Deltaproteobacteria bacterium]